MKRLVILLLVLIYSTSSAWAQCAMCKAVAESNMNGGDGLASGLNNGIVYLMFIPYLLIGSVAYLIYRHRKKQKQSQSA